MPGEGSPAALRTSEITRLAAFACSFDGNIYFGAGQTNIKPAIAEALRKGVVEIRKKQGRLYWRVIGHTDVDPAPAPGKPREDALEVSVQRALAVAKILEDGGIEETRIHVVGMGASAPVAPNDTEENRKNNRRVEIFVSSRPF